mmetsp:Transcript_27853/g.85022  ORF Transcript_27853/g.85022 Transcript_27853/m.85022 type:complete len:214 (+) Transcript_27853:1361-2002(+)
MSPVYKRTYNSWDGSRPAIASAPGSAERAAVTCATAATSSSSELASTPANPECCGTNTSLHSTPASRMDQSACSLVKWPGCVCGASVSTHPGEASADSVPDLAASCSVSPSFANSLLASPSSMSAISSSFASASAAAALLSVAHHASGPDGSGASCGSFSTSCARSATRSTTGAIPLRSSEWTNGCAPISSRRFLKRGQSSVKVSYSPPSPQG